MHSKKLSKPIIIIVIVIDVCNPLKNMCDFPFVLLSYLDLQAFLQQTSVNIQENVIPDSFRSMLFGGTFFTDSYGSWGVVRRGVASG